MLETERKLSLGAHFQLILEYRTVQWTGEYRAGVTLIYYRREGEQEEVHIPGPSLENLRFLVRYSVFQSQFILITVYQLTGVCYFHKD